VVEFTARPPLLKIRLLKLKIPLGGPIGVIEQHHVRTVLEPFGLLLHSSTILLDKLREHILK
jgi:hypothetical protein